MCLEWKVTQRMMSKFVVGCMQETVRKSWVKERLEERAIRKDLEDIEEVCLFFIAENKDQAHEK